MNKSVQQLLNLYEENRNNKEVCDKITSFICDRLPIEVVCWKKELDKNKIKMEQTNFITHFLNDETKQFYYIKDTNSYIKYDNLNYSLINEDELLYLILSEISKNKLLLSKKQMIKDIIIREIKTNVFGSGIPESSTIQNIINYFYPVLFKTKSEAKYFLCILGDNVLKKKSNTFYISRDSYKIFLEHINNCFNDYYNYDIIDNILYNIKKLNQCGDNTFKNTRVLDFKSSIQNKRFWQHFLDHNVLNMISVAIHYSGRYDNSDEYLKNKIEDKNKILYLSKNKKKDIIEKFIDKYIVEKKEEKITENELYYIWQLFLIEENIPCIFESKKEYFKAFNESLVYEKIQYKNNNYLNIFSEKLFIAREFNDFWNKCIKEDQNEMIEISEIFYFFKQKTNIKTSSERDIMFLIEYFYPYINITNNKNIINHSCALWNKKETIKNVIKEIKKEPNMEIKDIANIKLYKKYCQYLKDKKNELVVNKTYFMDVIQELKKN